MSQEKTRKLLQECQDLLFQLVFTETEHKNIQESQLTQFTSLAYIRHLMILNTILLAQAYYFMIRTMSPDESFQKIFFQVFDVSKQMSDLAKHLQKNFGIPIHEDVYACLYAIFHEQLHPLLENTRGVAIPEVSNIEDNIKTAEDRLRPAIKTLIQAHGMNVLFTQWYENPKVEYLTSCLGAIQDVPSSVAVLSLLQIFQKVSPSHLQGHIDNAHEIFTQKIRVSELLPWYLFTQHKNLQKSP